MISRLSDLLRITFDRSGSARVSLQEELEFLRKYLEIEQTRFQDRLSVLFDRDLTYSYREVRPYYVLTSWTGSVRHKLGSRLEVEARGGIEKLDYSVASSDGTTFAQPENVHLYGLRLSRGLGQASRIVVDLVHRDRTSPLEHRNYQSLQAGVSAIYGF